MVILRAALCIDGPFVDFEVKTPWIKLYPSPRRRRCLAMRLTRRQPYELVWDQPMTKLAAQFGISDVGKLSQLSGYLGWLLAERMRRC